MLINKPYQRTRAVEYARRWALDRNPLFVDFTGIGGNCTNFVSQCLLAGSCVMNYTPNFGWYYVSAEDRAPAWSSVEYFFEFLTGAPRFAEQNGGEGPYGRVVERALAMPGDAIQLANASGDWYHTLLISEILPDEILICAQSDDALDRPLSSYNYADLRFLHVDGVRFAWNDEVCYRTLLAGGVETIE